MRVVRRVVERVVRRARKVVRRVVKKARKVEGMARSRSFGERGVDGGGDEASDGSDYPK